ncbi:MAG: MarR family transcriptional regulator [Tahibacter sp.]
MNHDNKSFAYPLVDVTRLFRKHFDRRAEPLGLTRAQWRALKAIHRQEGLSQKALAELLEMEPIPIGRVVDRLQQAEFVERRADPTDRRCWRLYLTAKALGVVDAMEVISVGLRDDALKNVEETDLDTFVRVLGLMKQNLLALDDNSPTLRDLP